MIPVSIGQLAVANNRCCSCNWKEIGALVTAVAGVALSVFVQSVFGAIGFALFGVAVIYLHYDQMQTIAQMESQINKKLDEEEKKIADSTQQMGQKVQEIERDKDQFNQAIQRLTQENGQLQAAQRNLTVQEQRLTHDNEVLSRTKEDLEREVAAAKANVQQIDTEVKGLINENLRLGSVTGAFGKNVEALNIAKVQLTQEAQVVEGDAHQLVRQIQLVKNATGQIIGTMTQDLAHLQADVDQRHALELEVRTEIDRLKQGEAQFQKDTLALAQKETELNDLEKQIEAKRIQYQTDATMINEQLENRSQEVKDEEEKLKETMKKLNDLTSKQNTLIASNTKSLVEKKRELQVLEATIVKKREELQLLTDGSKE